MSILQSRTAMGEPCRKQSIFVWTRESDMCIVRQRNDYYSYRDNAIYSKEGYMSKGDKVSVRYIISTHNSETRSGIVEYISRYGWAAVSLWHCLKVKRR